MSALAEALLAAQRSAVGSLSKAYVAGNIDTDTLCHELDLIGLRDEVDQGLLIQSLTVVKERGGEAPNGQAETKRNEPASEAQRRYIASLSDDSGVIAPDGPLTKEEASTVIEQLKAGTYSADAWTVPF